MAKIDHSFHMDEAPAQAQERFEEEIGWELHRDEGFVAVKEQPGEIDYSEGRIDEVGEEAPLLPGGSSGVVAGARAGGGPTAEAFSALRELTGKRIKVDLGPAGSGTLVHIHGHAEGRLRDAIERLGTPGHWPQVRSSEGAPTEDR